MGINASTVLVNLRGNPLCDSILTGDKNRVVSSLERGHSVYVKDRAGVTPLVLAAVLRHTDIVKCLLNSPKLTIYRETETRRIVYPLLCGAYFGQKDVVSVMLKFRVPMIYAEWALFVSAYAGQPGVMKCLLEDYRLTIDITHSHGQQTLLHVSASGGQADLVRVLLYSAAIPVGMTSKSGWTPLHYAARHGHTRVVDILLNAGADVNAADKEGQTALHVAVDAFGKHRKRDVVERLLNSGAKVDPLDNKGRTPLYIALRNGNAEMEQLLRQRKRFQTPKKRPWYAGFFSCRYSDTTSTIESAIQKGRFHDLAAKLSDFCERCRHLSGREIVSQRSDEDLGELENYIRVNYRRGTTADQGRSSDRAGLGAGTSAASMTPAAATNTSGSEEADVSHQTAATLNRDGPGSPPGPGTDNQIAMSELGLPSFIHPENSNSQINYNISQLTVMQGPVYNNSHDNRGGTTNVRRAENVAIGEGGIEIVQQPTTETEETSDESDDSFETCSDKSGDGSGSEYEDAQTFLNESD